MQSPVASTILAAMLLVAALGGSAPALSQDFSITNPAEPPAPGRRNLVRQLQAWWDGHAFYPRRASRNDEGGTVRLHLMIDPDGRIFRIEVVGSSGSDSLDLAALSTFRNGFVQPFPAGEPGAELDLSLHYVLAHRHDQPVPAGYVPTPPRRPFTITNDPVRSPILETMLQRTCTGKVVTQGIRNHPAYGVRHWAQAVFFRKPDGTPWVKLYEGGYSTLSPVVEVGKLVQWTGREQRLGGGNSGYIQYTVWADGDNNLNGNIETIYFGAAKANQPINRGGTVDFSCSTEIVPAITWSALAVTPGDPPIGDPP